MPDQFEDILREAVVTFDTVDVSALKAAVRPTGVKAKLPLTLDLVRLAHHQRATADGDAAFRKAIRGKEGLVEETGQRQLISILATCCLIDAFSLDKGAELGITSAALAVRTVRLGGWTPAHVDLRPFADRWLAFQAQAARPLPTWPEPLTRPAELEAIQAPTLEQPSVEQAFTSINSHMVQLQAEQKQLRDAVGALAAAATLDYRANREQRDVLWWLQSASKPREARLAATTAASDLASFTQLIPGPLASEQILRRRLGPSFDEVIPVAELNGLARTGMWPGLNVAIPPATRDLFPVLTYLRGETTGGISEESLTGGELARALYDEVMLAHAVRSLV